MGVVWASHAEVVWGDRRHQSQLVTLCVCVSSLVFPRVRNHGNLWLPCVSSCGKPWQPMVAMVSHTRKHDDYASSDCKSLSVLSVNNCCDSDCVHARPVVRDAC